MVTNCVPYRFTYLLEGCNLINLLYNLFRVLLTFFSLLRRRLSDCALLAGCGSVG